MKMIRFIAVILLLTWGVSFHVSAQSTSVTGRTPEQEALKQTEKLQKELDLSTEQAKNIYEINLKYARERKQSNKRSEALERSRKKNDEIGRVLNEKQMHELNTKRSLQSIEIDGERRYTRTNQQTIIKEQPVRINSDRPVRTDHRQPLSNSQSSSSNSVNRPVKPQESRPAHSENDVNNRIQASPNRPVRTPSSTVKPAERSTERPAPNPSATPSRENPSRPVRK